MKLLIKIFILNLFFFTKLFAQQPVMKHYTSNEGLPSSEVYEVIQDKKGYIWFSTDRGVCKFDGYSFKTYTTDDGLCDNTVLGIYEDPKERLWFHTYSGEICMLDKEKFSNIQNPLIPKQMLNYHSLVVDEKDNLWVGYYNKEYSVFQFSPDFKKYWAKSFDTDQSCNAILIKEIKKSTFIATLLPRNCLKNEPLTIRFIDSLNKQFNFTLQGTHSYYLKYKIQLYRIIQLSTGDYLFTLGKDLFRLNKKREIETIPLENEPISLYEDKKGTIWIGYLNNGVACYDPQKLFSSTLQKIKNIPFHFFLNGKSVSSILQDKENSYWFTTLEDAVYHLSTLEIESFTKENGLQNNKVLSVIGNGKKSEDIFIGMQDGWLNKIKKGKVLPIYTAAISFRGNAINSLFRSFNGEIWCVCDRSGIYNASRSRYLNNLELTSSKALLQTNPSTVWVTLHKGIAKLSISRNSTISKIENYNYSSLSPRALCAQGDTLWIGTLNGLYSYHNSTFKFHGTENPLLTNRITDIKKTSNGYLWIATRGAGVLIKNNEKIKSISTRQGLSNNLCNSIYISKGDTVWVSTNNGLNRITGNYFKGYQVKTLTTSNGLASNEVNQVYQSANTLWVATNNGISFFDVRTLKIDSSSPPVYITGIKINNKDTLLQLIYNLDYEQNNLNITFVGLSYKNSGKIKYKYRLEGLDSNWIYTTDINAQFIKLPPGSYKFGVLAMSNEGYWSNKAAYVKIFIVTPYWKTWWFRMFIILFFLGNGLWFFRFRIRQIITRNKLLYELNRSKQQALAAQMNPHFIFNAMNSIRNYILDHDVEEADKYLTKFSKLIRLILDNSNKVYITLEEELNTLNLYLELEALRFKERFTYTIQVDSALDKNGYKIPAMIIQPFVENAIWHGIMPKKEGTGILNISFNLIDKYLLCTVEDNGIGRDLSTQINKRIREQLNHTPIGMALSEKRLSLNNSIYNQDMSVKIIDLKNENGNPTGTKVEIYFMAIPKKIM